MVRGAELAHVATRLGEDDLAARRPVRPVRGMVSRLSRACTYEHREAVADHWNPDNMEAMEKSKNSRVGAMMNARYSQETGPNYSCS